MKRCLLVVGMHRSGTSALAGALRELGVDFGDDLMPGRVGHNEKGYFESLSLVGLNSLALELGGSHWQALAGPPAEWFLSHDATASLGSLISGR